MKRNWVIALMMGLLLVVMTACSSANNVSDKSESPVGQAETSNTGTNTEANTQERVVKSLKGDITIPADPKRVIGLSVVYPEFLYALGITPIAVQNYHQDFPAYLQDAFKDTLKMGISQTPNFEAILAADPELIIAPGWWAEKDYDQLSKIAPTVILPQREDWKDELRDIAEVLDKKELAETVMQDLQAKADQAKEKLHSLIGDESVMYMMIMEKEFVIYGENSSRGTFIHKQLGLKSMPNYPQEELSQSISLEKIPEYNPEHIILQLDDDTNKEIIDRYEEMLNGALWKNMTAVKKKQVYIMGGKEWFNLGMSPLAESYAIDEVVRAFENKRN